MQPQLIRELEALLGPNGRIVYPLKI